MVLDYEFIKSEKTSVTDGFQRTPRISFKEILSSQILRENKIIVNTVTLPEPEKR